MKVFDKRFGNRAFDGLLYVIAMLLIVAVFPVVYAVYFWRRLKK